jgi:hypothetical protein
MFLGRNQAALENSVRQREGNNESFDQRRRFEELHRKPGVYKRYLAAQWRRMADATRRQIEIHGPGTESGAPQVDPPRQKKGSRHA